MRAEPSDGEVAAGARANDERILINDRRNHGNDETGSGPDQSRAAAPRSTSRSEASWRPIENPVWAGLMATFCRSQGPVGRDHRRRGRGADRRPRWPSASQHLDPVLAVVVVYGHQPSASTQIMTASGDGLHGDQAADSRAERPASSAATSPPCRSARCARKQADFVAGGEGLHTMVAAGRRRCKAPAPNFARCAGPLVSRRTARCAQHSRSAAGRRSRRRDARRRLGPAADGQLPGPQLALPRRPASASPTRPSTRRSAVPTTAPSAASRPRSRAARRPAASSETTNSYRYWTPDTVIDQIDMLVNKYGVRNIKIADEMFVLNKTARPGHLRPDHRARLRPEHLGLHARRHRSRTACWTN